MATFNFCFFPKRFPLVGVSPVPSAYPVTSQKQDKNSLASLKLNRCKIRVGDEITALYIGNPITENYPTDAWHNLITLSNNLTICTCKTSATNGILLENNNGIDYRESVKDLDIANLEDFDTTRPDRIYLGQYGNRQNQDNIKSQKDCIIYFTKPLTVTLALTNNSHFDEDFQGIVAFTNTGRVNTGAFDPASDYPASQKSLTDFIIATDLHARYSRVASGNISGAFAGLPSRYSGKYHLLEPSPFLWGEAFTATLLFAASSVKEIDNSDALNDMFVHASTTDMSYAFYNDNDLAMISATYSLSRVVDLNHAFDYCYNLRTIKLRDFSVSFNISGSINFGQSDLVEIIGNLVDLTGKQSQTLTMGATNLAKLTGVEKAVAINKNWVLA